MYDFSTYLKSKGFQPSTVSQHQKILVHFTAWLEAHHLLLESLSYPNLLEYIQQLKSKGLQPQTINLRLNSLRHYFEYLILQGVVVENPAKELTVKGTRQKLLDNLLSPDELEDLYYSYVTDKDAAPAELTRKQAVAKRNKIIVGLLVYQGLTTTDLKRLRIEDVDLYKGKIQLLGGQRSHQRVLSLRSWQVMELMEYTNTYRRLLESHSPADNELLIAPQKHLSDLLSRGLIPKLRKTNQKARSIRQLRSSVIVNWLKQYPIRKVQYMAGHKYISSTEAYRTDNIEQLHKAIGKYHPLR